MASNPSNAYNASDDSSNYHNNSNLAPYGTPLRSFYGVTFPPPNMQPHPVPWYPDENVPRFAEVFVEANKHLLPASRLQGAPMAPVTEDKKGS